MQRTSLVLVVASLTVLASVGGASAAAISAQGVDADTGLGGLAQQTGGSLFGSSELPDEVATFGGDPGWHVAVDDRSALENWANSSDQREILSYDAQHNTSVVAAPAGHIGTGFVDRLLGNGLHARDYVQSIAVVQEVDTPEPPEPVSRETFEGPERGILADLRGPSYATAGIAFTEDANRSTLAEARATINADATSADGSSVTVAVLDDGVTYDQSLYGDRFVDGYDFVADRDATAANDWQNVSSAGGHGDWVASALAANATNDSSVGVAPSAEIYVAKTLGANGGTSKDIVDGLQWANEHDVDVVSMSLGSQVYNAAIDAAVQDLVDNGTVVVIAAGNSAGTIPVGIASPADSLGEDPQTDGIITVAATNVTANASDAGVAHFSQRGPDPGAAATTFGATRGADPTVAAPGMEITAKTAGGESTLSGTSMATPLVSGSAALLLEQHPTANVSEIEQRLAHGATPINGSGYHEVGAGMVNVEQALATQPDPDADYYADQREARIDAAQARDSIYAGLAADARGQWASIQEAIGG